MFSKETYIRRRRTLLEKMKGEKGIAVFTGNTESPAQYRDNCYKWRQDSTWLYLWGIDEPRFAAILDLESGEEKIYADDFGIDDIIWMGPMESVSSQAAAVGVDKTSPYAEFVRDACEARAKGRTIHFVPASREYNASVISEITGLSPADCISKGRKGCEHASATLVNALVEMRLVKEDVEIEELDAVAELGFEMHSTARRMIKPGIVEQEIVGAMEGITLAKGWGTSFPTILTQHGEIFHCHSHAGTIVPGKLAVVDAGVESNSHYASDHTRTYPTSGKFTPRQRDIYSIVCECNNYAFSLIKPGIRYKDIHLDVAALMLERLVDVGLVKGSVEDMKNEGVAGLFMPHGLGHNMGLDVHDMEDYGEDILGYDRDQKRSSQLGLGSLRMARKLQKGHVITDEPGIYFIPDLIEKWKREGKCKEFINYDKLASWYDFGGIRLEDDVIVTADGARRTGSRRLPITVEEVEEAMAND